MSKIPRRYYIWQMVKLALFARLTKILKALLLANTKSVTIKKLVVLAALFGAAIISKVLVKVWDWCLLKAFKYDALNGIDEFFLDHR